MAHNEAACGHGHTQQVFSDQWLQYHCLLRKETQSIKNYILTRPSQAEVSTAAVICRSSDLETGCRSIKAKLCQLQRWHGAVLL